MDLQDLSLSERAEYAALSILRDAEELAALIRHNPCVDFKPAIEALNNLAGVVAPLSETRAKQGATYREIFLCVALLAAWRHAEFFHGPGMTREQWLATADGDWAEFSFQQRWPA